MIDLVSYAVRLSVDVQLNFLVLSNMLIYKFLIRTSESEVQITCTVTTMLKSEYQENGPFEAVEIIRNKQRLSY